MTTKSYKSHDTKLSHMTTKPIITLPQYMSPQILLQYELNNHKITYLTQCYMYTGLQSDVVGNNIWLQNGQFVLHVLVNLNTQNCNNNNLVIGPFMSWSKKKKDA